MSKKSISVFILLVFSLIIISSKTFAQDPSVVINEFLSHPSSGNDWIELYNPTDSEIDISNWKAVDSASTMKTFSSGTIIEPYGFYTFEVSNRLNNNGDNIIIKDKDDNTVDQKDYNTDPGVGISIGRVYDGSPDWTTFLTPTPGSSNGSPPTPTPTSSPTFSPTPTPTPSPTPTPTPTLSPTPTPTPTPTSTPTPSPSPTLSPSPTISPSPSPSPSPPIPDFEAFRQFMNQKRLELKIYFDLQRQKLNEFRQSLREYFSQLRPKI
jgi:hypothetical protein